MKPKAYYAESMSAYVDQCDHVTGISIITRQGGYRISCALDSVLKVSSVDFVFETSIDDDIETISVMPVPADELVLSHILLCVFRYHGGMIMVLREATNSDQFCLCYFSSHLVHDEVTEWLASIGIRNALNLSRESLGTLQCVLEEKRLFQYHYVGRIIPEHSQRLILNIAQVWPIVKEFGRLVHRPFKF